MVTSAGFALSFVLAVGVGLILYAQDLPGSPLLIAVILSATSLGIILPALVDAGQSTTAFGQLVIAGGSIAEVVPVVLLSVLFSAASGGTWSQVVLLLAFLGLAVAIGLAIVGLERIDMDLPDVAEPAGDDRRDPAAWRLFYCSLCLPQWPRSSDWRQSSVHFMGQRRAQAGGPLIG